MGHFIGFSQKYYKKYSYFIQEEHDIHTEE